MQTIQRQLKEDGSCILTFDRPDSPVNIFDVGTLDELEAHLEAIAQPGLGVKSLLIISSKPAVFIAGADLRAIQQMSQDALGRFIDLGQRIFAKLAALRFTTVAAIHGACVGGGCELALACDWRVATVDHSTKIGLPETKLGILPAWGGSTRMPRLIGLAAALDIILGGKTLAAKAALKRGLVDAVAPSEHLLAAALPWLKKGKRKHELPIGDAVSAPFIRGKVRADLMKKTRGHYPALLEALEVATRAPALKDPVAMALEKAAVLKLSALPSSRSLIRLFFQQERAKKFTFPGTPPPAPVGAAAVIGAGVMGSAIAQWISSRGRRVILRDIDASRVAAGMASITQLFDAGVRRHLFTPKEARDGIDRISPAPAEVPLHAVDLVIEAAVEKMEIKKKVFARLDDLTRPDAILATNTSALSISELARATRHPERVVGLHFFNPVQQMQLVEVIKAPETSPAVAERAIRFVQSIGKLPVLVKDSPGFVVNRILLPYMVEAAELFWAGSKIAEIDESMLDFGMPMGPLRLTDEVGIDVAEDVSATLTSAFPEWMRAPRILPKMLEAKLLGKKSGAGFYQHPKGKEPSVNNALRKLRPKGGQPFPREELALRMVLLMINEAARCLEEKIVETAADIDFAMVMGTGFAPFRGGPLRHADALGIEKVVDDLARFAQTGLHFKPCALLVNLARNKGKFYEDSNPSPG